jgi:hypothetical protein
MADLVMERPFLQMSYAGFQKESTYEASKITNIQPKIN